MLCLCVIISNLFHIKEKFATIHSISKTQRNSICQRVGCTLVSSFSCLQKFSRGTENITNIVNQNINKQQQRLFSDFVQSSRVTEQKRGRLGRKQGGEVRVAGSTPYGLCILPSKESCRYKVVLFATGALHQSPHSFSGAAAAKRRPRAAAAMHHQRYAALPQSCMMYFEQ